jgi:hypothetical protein
MHPLMELVDQFMEDLFNGHIITFQYEKIDTTGKEEPVLFHQLRTSEEVRKQIFGLTSEFASLVPVYASTEGHTERNAMILYNDITLLRLYGIFQNNPNNLKELNFYRSRAELQAKDIQERDEQIAGAMETIKKLRTELAGKDMFR